MNMTDSEREMAPVLYADPCAYCGAPSAAVDHIEPRRRGGERTWENLAGACVPCNSRKSDRPLLLFLLGEPGPPRPPAFVPASRRSAPRRPRPVPEIDMTMPVEDAIDSLYAADLSPAARRHAVRLLIELAFDETGRRRY